MLQHPARNAGQTAHRTNTGGINLIIYQRAWTAADETIPAGVSGQSRKPLLNAAAYGGLAFLSGLHCPKFNIAPSDYAAVTGPVAGTGENN